MERSGGVWRRTDVRIRPGLDNNHLSAREYERTRAVCVRETRPRKFFNLTLLTPLPILTPV